MDNIESLSIARVKKIDDNRLITPIECLNDVVHDLETREIACNKLMIIRLNTNPDDKYYDVNFNCCNLSTQEMIALLEIVKSILLDDINHGSKD